MPRKIQKVPPGEIGSSGLRINSGFLHEEFDPKLRGPKGAEKYRAMRDNSAAAGSALHAIEIVLRQVAVEVEPASGSDEDASRAEFLESCLHDMSFSWSDTVVEQLTMLQHGYALSEIVYKRREGYREDGQGSKHDDGRVGWQKIALRGQETIVRWETDSHGGIRGAWQQAPPSYREVFIPIERALLFRVSKERNNPEGRSLLRSAWWSWYCSKRLSEIMLIGAERDLAGLPIARVPSAMMKPDATPDDKQAFEAYKELVRNVRHGEQAGIVLSSELAEGGQQYVYDLELLASGGKREFDVAGLVLQYDRWILTVLLADMLMMGHQAVGSFALAEGKSGLFEQALNGYLAIIDATMNQYAVPRLMRMNGWPADSCPRIRHKGIDHQSLAQLADYLSKLANAGMPLFPDERLETHLRKRAHLPPSSGTAEGKEPAVGTAGEEESEPEPPPPQQPPAAPPEKKRRKDDDDDE